MEKFNICFSGETLPEHDLATVKQGFARWFHIQENYRVDAFFSGQQITLRRNLDKAEAAGVFVALRQMGIVTHIEKVEAEEVILAGAEQAAPAPRRRKRQPGAPNLFDVQLSERAGIDADQTSVSKSLATAPIIAAAIVFLAFMLVGLRFWAESWVQPDFGLGTVAVDPHQQPVVQIGEQLLFHDRAGLATRDVALASFGFENASAFDFFDNGDLLILQQEPPATVPVWLQTWLGMQERAGASLRRCQIESGNCETLLAELGPTSFVVDRRTDQIYLADAQADSLRKLSSAGKTIASRAIELTDPLHLNLQEGILYLTQSGTDAVLVVKPDDREFGKALDTINLKVANASQTGHIYPGDVAWFNERWWAIMQSRDGSTAGLYLFSPRWQFERRVELPDTAHPAALARWSAKMLVSDLGSETIYRFDAATRAEKEFSSASISSSLGERQSRLSMSSLLQVLILLMLFVTAAALLALGILQSLRGKVYIPPADSNERGFDINNEAIDWLAPAPDSEKKMRIAGYGIAGFATLLLLGAFTAQFSIWTMIAISLILAGCGGYYFALHRAAGCHLGLHDGNLIVVDHTSTYRVGTGPNIQYFHNYVMIDDVIVYLGNPLLKQFAGGPWQEKFAPVVHTGIKIDRTTLRVRLIQNRHPMLLGIFGLVLAIACALLLVLLT